MTNIRRKIIQGVDDSGSLRDFKATKEGHLEVDLHGPRLPFGSIHTESMEVEFQTDAVYQINPYHTFVTSSLGGSVSAIDGKFVCNTGTTANANASLQSRKRLRYRPGKGSIGRFTAVFDTPVANSTQVAGLGHAEDGLYIGYVGTTFGILHNYRGVRETRTLTVSAASTTAEDVNVTLNGTTYTVPVTNSANVQRTVYEISNYDFSGWTACPEASSITFVRGSAGTASGAYSLSATTAGGSFAQTKAGASPGADFIPQASFNGDPLDGTGPSGETIDPTKGNVYEMFVQYLGYGALTVRAEVAAAGNDPRFIDIHTIRWPNTSTDTNFGNPSFPFTLAVASQGSTTDLSAQCASYAGFTEGKKKLEGDRFSYTNDLGSTVDAAGDYYALFSIQNKNFHANRSNQSVVNVVDLTAATKHTQPVKFFVIKNGTLTGNPNFQPESTYSTVVYDTDATGVTISGPEDIIWSAAVGETGQIEHIFRDEGIDLQPNEMITIAAQTVQNTASWVTATLNTKEDH